MATNLKTAKSARKRPARVAPVDSAGVRTHAQQQARTLLRRLAFQVNQTARIGDADSVHDLRVAIRRFNQCLRVFQRFFPKPAVRKIRRRLKGIMAQAGAVRDCDITMDLIQSAGVPSKSRVSGTLQKERVLAEQALLKTIRRLGRDNFSVKWRVRLEL